MNKLLLKIFALILIYNNSHSITCDNIKEKINELDKDSQKVLVINYSTEKIIILKGTTNYLAYIGNINAVVNYIQCSEIYDNSLLFNNIEDKSVVYSLQLSKGIKDLTLEVKFNTIDHITDENKLEQIHNIFSNSNTQKYITSQHEIERLFDAHHNDYNLGFFKHQKYNMLEDVVGDPYHLLDEKEPSYNISTDLFDEEYITDYSDYPHANVTTKNPRSIKRKLENEGESGTKKQRLSDTDDEKASAHLEELRFEDLPKKLKEFIVNNGKFKDQFDILYLISPAENLPLDKFIINKHMDKILEQLKSGEKLILLNKELAMDKIKNKKLSKLRNIFIVIEKIDDSYYNIYTFIINKHRNKIVFYKKDETKKINFINRSIKKHVELSIVHGSYYVSVDNFYIIGSLSIKKKVDEIITQLQGQSSTDNAVNESTVLQKNHSLKDILDTEFKSNNYYIDEEYRNRPSIELKLQYLRNEIVISNSENLFVFIKNKFSVDGNNKLITARDKKVGIILKKKYLADTKKFSYEVKYIKQGMHTSDYFTADSKILCNDNPSFHKDKNSIRIILCGSLLYITDYYLITYIPHYF